MRRWKAETLNSDALFERKRQAVLREAAWAFLERGYNGTALDDIAGALGVTKAALYYYVRSKQDILAQCHRLALDLAEAALAQAQARDGSTRDRLERFLASYTEAARSDMGVCLFLDDLAHLEPDARVEIEARRRAFDDRLSQLIAAGQTDGSLRVDIPAPAQTTFVLGSLRGVFLRTLPGGRGDPEPEPTPAPFAGALRSPSPDTPRTGEADTAEALPDLVRILMSGVAHSPGATAMASCA